MRLVLILVLGLVSLNLYAQILDKSWLEIVHNSDATFYASEEAKSIAKNVLLYQRDIGGWPKNIPMQKALSKTQKDELKALKSSANDVTTDNGATTQEMLFLSKIYKQQPDERYKIAFLKGLDYLLEAQYENGGWPQFYPLRDGYYSHITYNDNSMVNILNLLKELNDGSDVFSIKPPREILKKSELAFHKGIDCILKTQYRQNGVLTGWCAQYDADTLEPAKARAYELPSLSGGESAGIVDLLMHIEKPSQDIVEAVNAAVKWFEDTKITGIAQESVLDTNGKRIDKKIVTDANAPSLWARFMELDDNTPFFSDRDGIKKTSLADIGVERRNGYAWYVDSPQKVLNNYPEWRAKIVKMDFKILQDQYYMVVAKDGSGDYETIQEAINNTKAFPYERIIIYIKNGVYKEKVKIHEWNTNISLVGESKERAIITYDDYFNKIGLGRNSTFYTYTLLVEANDCILKNLTIENSSGEVGQAVALSIFSDRVAIVNCNLLGNQDTLYASGIGKQYYKDCYIEGTTDFIFGSATAFFENCEIYSKRNSYITAASTPQDTSYGYVFKNCKITADASVNEVYLGRPWRVYAKTVFINCDLGKHILPVGWHNWNKLEAEQSAFYAEFENTGKGFTPKQRVPWSHQLKASEAKTYTLKNVLGEHKNESQKEWYEGM